MSNTSQTSFDNASVEIEIGNQEQALDQELELPPDYGLDSFDLIGIGFGPSNLSLSVRLAEENLTNTPQILRPKTVVSNAKYGNLNKSLKACFIESNHCFCWHPGMMIDGSRMQISFLKDLVTLRNPCSPFSFLNYLHHHQRLIAFINCATFTPTRLEFADYMAWVSRQVTSCSSPSFSPASSHIHNSISLRYGERVVSVKGVLGTSGDVEFLRVSSIKSANGSLQHYLCRNLIISVGGTPRIPPFCEELLYQPLRKSCYVIHTSTFLSQIDHILSNIIQLASAFSKHNQQKLQISKPTANQLQSSIGAVSSTCSDDEPGSDSAPADSVSIDQSSSENSIKLKIAIIGAGQSAAETLLETYSRLKSSLSNIKSLDNRAEIDLIVKQGQLKPSDDSPFVNQVFNPKSTDFFYEMTSKAPSTRAKNPGRTHHQKNLKDFLLKESASTNYAVVNPETLTALHELIYTQKVQEDMEPGQFSDRDQFQDPKINIINFAEMISAKPNSNMDGSVNVVLRNVLTGTQTISHYHVVILGTGYLRQTWKQILFSGSTDPSEAVDFGIPLADLWPNLSMELPPQHDFSMDPATEDSPTNSILWSRSSEDQDHASCCLSETSQKSLNDVKVARNYRLLLPKTFIAPNPSSSDPHVKKFRPTIWLQGCNESTHGISDSLLSVLSVRSGEIFEGIQEEGWFGQPSDTTDKDSNESCTI